MPVTRDDVIAAADELLEPERFRDYCPNGVQVLGRREDVEVIATAVSSTRATFEAAAEAGAAVLIAHHGLFWKSTPQVIDAVMRTRLETLFDNGITLAGYHLPLDAHPEVGNNARLVAELGLSPTGIPFAEHGGAAIGIVAEAPGEGIEREELIARVTSACAGRVPLALGAMPERIHRIGICSGGASGDVVEAAALGCDAFLTGEPHESTHAHAQELGIGFLAAGHHATERLGPIALGERLAAQLGIEHVFIDADNPV